MRLQLGPHGRGDGGDLLLQTGDAVALGGQLAAELLVLRLAASLRRSEPRLQLGARTLRLLPQRREL